MEARELVPVAVRLRGAWDDVREALRPSEAALVEVRPLAALRVAEEREETRASELARALDVRVRGAEEEAEALVAEAFVLLDSVALEEEARLRPPLETEGRFAALRGVCERLSVTAYAFPSSAFAFCKADQAVLT